MAMGYGMVSFLALPIVDVVSWKLNDPGTGVISYLQVSYFDLFHTEHGLELIALIPSVISSLLYGLMLGVVFAVLLAECSEYPRFILAIYRCLYPSRLVLEELSAYAIRRSALQFPWLAPADSNKSL